MCPSDIAAGIGLAQLENLDRNQSRRREIWDIYQSDTTLRYHPLHMNALYNSRQKLENCERLNDIGLNIPLHPSLSDSDIDKIIEEMRQCPYIRQ